MPMTSLPGRAACRLVALCLVVATGATAAELQFDTAPYSQEATGCDLLAAHPDDPNRVAPGLKQSQIDLPVAIAACEAAVEREPKNPRLQYQLGRVYGYSGLGEKAVAHRAAAIAGDYPQALFVNGYLHLEGINKAQKDPCVAAELLHESARYGRIAGEIGYPMWSLEGRFSECAIEPDYAEMLRFLDDADAQTGDFYKESLIALLRRDVNARLEEQGGRGS